MDYLLLLLPLAILLLCGSSNGSGSTWSPFQSDQVKAICAHMTAEELSKASRRSAGIGALLGALIGGGQFIAMVMGKWLFDSSRIGRMSILLAPLILTGLALWKFTPRFDRSHKEFLASTQWSKEEGFRPEDIVLRRS